MRPCPDLARREPAGPSKPRVLLVEDNEIHRKVVLRLLDQLGREGIAVADASAAARALESGGFDLILMPLDLAGMDGFAAIREIRLLEESFKLPRVPILAVVGVESGLDRRQAAEAGMDGHLTRPVTRRSLEAALAALGDAGRRREPLDRADLIRRCGGDVGFVSELLASFSESVMYSVGILREAIEAGDLARAIDSAHGLKGCARTVAAGPLADACADLEREAQAGDVAGSREALGRVLDAWSDLLPALRIPTECQR